MKRHSANSRKSSKARCLHCGLGERTTRGPLTDYGRGSGTPVGIYHEPCRREVRVNLGLDAPPDLKKLPQRFQRYIGLLRDRVHTLERLAPSDEKTLVSIVSRGREEERAYFKNSSRLRFELSGGRTIEVKLDPEGECIEIYGEQALAVWPNVSNVVRVTFQR
jgi:hypothetical protein